MVKSLWNHAWNMICIHCLGTGGSFPAFWLFLALKPSRISLTLCAIFTGGPYPVSGQTHRKDMEKPWTTPQVMVRSKVQDCSLLTSLHHVGTSLSPSTPVNMPCLSSFREDVQKALSEKWRCQAPHLEVVQIKIFQDDRMTIKSLRICPGTKELRYQRSRNNLNAHKRAWEYKWPDQYL